MLNIALDGPAGAGKSTMAQLLAESLDVLYLDTGAMYRALAYKVLKNDIDPRDREEVSALLPETDVCVKYENGQMQLWLDGNKVGEEIRSPEVGMAASAVSAHPEVRLFMVELQRKIASEHDLVLDGREIGTFVLPNTPYKLFLTASVEERALRRYEQWGARADRPTLEEVEASIRQRDEADRKRDYAPLLCADDAVVIDSTGLEREETIVRLLEAIERIRSNEQNNQ